MRIAAGVTSDADGEPKAKALFLNIVLGGLVYNAA